MLSALQLPEGKVRVVCPSIDLPLEVRVARTPDGEVTLCGCARYWGKLRCDGACADQALAAFEALERSKIVALAETVYCGHPNIAAPRPREGAPANA